jgi:hypothetical protein
LKQSPLAHLRNVVDFGLLLGFVLGSAACASSSTEGERTDEERYERGRYIVEAVADCQACHTRRLPPDFAIIVGGELAGGEEFGKEFLLPGEFITPNLTPDKETGLGNWSAEEIKDAIRNGVRRDGQRLFPLMPSHFYRAMSESDLDDSVFYLQRLPARRPPIPGETQLYIKRSDIPPLPPLEGPVPPPAEDPVSQGKYLMTIGNCLTCHSPSENGQLIEERYLAGGVKITAPWGVSSTPNITPAVETGIADYTEEAFIRLMREGIKNNGQPILMNYMPWYAYKYMTDVDLKAIYVYLMSITPIENDVYRPENQFPLGN